MTKKKGDFAYTSISTEEAAKTVAPLFTQTAENLPDLIRTNLEKTYDQEFAPLVLETVYFPEAESEPRPDPERDAASFTMNQDTIAPEHQPDPDTAMFTAGDDMEQDTITPEPQPDPDTAMFTAGDDIEQDTIAPEPHPEPDTAVFTGDNDIGQYTIAPEPQPDLGTTVFTAGSNMEQDTIAPEPHPEPDTAVFTGDNDIGQHTIVPEPQPHSQPTFFYTNIYEAIVKRCAKEYLERFNCCTCSRCEADTIALALTNLPSKYIITDYDNVAPLVSFYESRMQSLIITEITKACLSVNAHPRH